MANVIIISVLILLVCVDEGRSWKKPFFDICGDKKVYNSIKNESGGVK